MVFTRSQLFLALLFITLGSMAQTFSWSGYPTNSATWNPSAVFNYTKATAGGGSFDVRESGSAGTSAISGTAGSIAQNCSTYTGLRLEMSGAGNSAGTGIWNNNITLTVTFPTYLCAPVTFNVYDITEAIYNDGTTNWVYYQDKVTISALDNSNNPVIPGATTSGPIDNVISGNNRVLTANTLNGQCTNQAVSVGVAGQKIKQITIVYSNQDLPTHCPAPNSSPYRYGFSQYQYIFISPITGTAAPTATITPAAFPCGSATTTLTAGTSAGAPVYQWTGPGGSTVVSPAASSTSVTGAGTYTLTINPAGCSSTATYTLTVGTPPNLSMGSAQSITCSNLTPTVSASSSTGGVTYSWSGPGTVSPNNAASGTVNTSGTYTVTITQTSTGCTNTGTVDVSANTSPPNISMGAGQSVSCASTTATVSGSSSTGGVNYAWTGPGTITPNNAASGTVSTAGTYTLTISNPANGCTSTGTVLVSTNTTPPNISMGGAQSITCSSTTPSISGSSSTGGVNYAWTGPGTITPNNAPSGTVGTAGTYTLTVSNPANGCTSTGTVLVSPNNTPPNISMGGAQSITCSSTTPSVSGSSSTGGVNYAWTGPGAITPNNAASGTVSAAGTYTLTISNPANGCTSTGTVLVTPNNTPPNIAMGSAQSISCGAAPTISGSSSTGGVNYAWTGPGAITPNNAASGTVSVAGTYTLTITNPANGCTSTGTVPVSTNTSAPNVSAGSNQTLNCSTTSVTLSGSSSTAGATFSWSGPAAGNPAGTAPTSASTSVTAQGTYTLTVTDPSNSCSASSTVMVSMSGSLPNSSAGSNQVISCSASSVTLSGSSSTGGVNFAWTGPTSGTPAGTTPGAASTLVSASGTYTLTVTDPGNGCSSVSTVLVSVNTATPNVSTGAGQLITCSASSVILSGNSATPNTTYAWTGPTVGAAAGTTPDNDSTLVSVNGTYTLTVTDSSNGCTATGTVSVSTNMNPPAISAGGDQTLTCSVTTVTLSGSSLTNGATFSWEGPSAGTPAGTTPATSSTDVSVAGTYTLTVTDPANGCTASSSVLVSSSGNLPNLSMGNDQVLTCSDSSVILIGSSTTNGVNYAWTGPGTITPNNAASGTATVAGTYTLTVSDPANGCSSASTVNVTSNTTLPDANAGTAQIINCNANAVTLSGSSLTPGAIFAWTGPGTITPSNAASAAVTAPGTYTLTVTDPANGCTETSTVAVNGSTTAPQVSTAASPTLSCSSSSVTISGSSSTPGATFYWEGPLTGSPAGTTPDNDSTDVALAGTYTLTVTDTSNFCTSTATLVVNASSSLPQISVSSAQFLTCTANAATVSGSSTNSNVIYSWSGPGTISPNNASSGSVNTAGTYTLTITDTLNGCSASATVSVTTNTTAPDASVATAQLITCNNPFTLLSGSSTTSGASFAWEGPTAGTPAGTTPANDSTAVAAAGTYTLVVTDPLNGCTNNSMTVTVGANTAVPQVSANTTTGFNCSLSPVIISGSSTTNGATFSWTGPSAGAPAGTTPANDSTTVAIAGTYTLTVTDPANGCSASTTVIIAPNAGSPQINAGANQVLNCSNSSVTLNGSSSSSGAVFSWEGPLAGVPAGTTPANASTVISQSGTYTLTVTDPANGCSSTQQVIVSTDTLVPTLSANSGGNSSISCLQSNVNLSATASGNATISWTGPTGIIPGNPVTVNTAGTYTVIALDPLNGCSASSVISISGNTNPPAIAASTTNDTLSCAANTANLNINTINPNLVFTWAGPNNFSSSQQNLSGIAVAGTYSITVTDTTNGCSVSDSMIIYQGIDPNAGFTATPTSGISPLNVSFTNTSSSGFSGYAWSFGDGNFSTLTSPLELFTSPGTYTVTLLGLHAATGCNDTASIVITVEEEASVEIPNVFTPNGDGTNDLFFIKSKGLKDLRVDIFNRWGQLEKQLFGINATWDGMNMNSEKATDGTYYYILYATALDGKETDKAGHLLLTR